MDQLNDGLLEVQSGDLLPEEAALLARWEREDRPPVTAEDLAVLFAQGLLVVLPGADEDPWPT